ncbi:MAG: sortase B protein-sorting domain-containing protein [Candidatus Limnocylindria bacterium]
MALFGALLAGLGAYLLRRRTP